MAEYEQDIGIRPGTFCAYDVRIDRIFDLTATDVIGALGIDPMDRFAPWKTILLVEGLVPPGWRIAEALLARGANGVLVPSARLTGGTNLVLWRWNDGPERTVIALDPETDLPRDQESWRGR